MKLFHGSNMMIDKVDLSKSKLYNFGQAFYLSAEKEQAQKMAEAKVVQFGGDKSITEFEFDESYMANNKLEVKIFTEYSKEWAEFVFNNRDKLNNRPRKRLGYLTPNEKFNLLLTN